MFRELDPEKLVGTVARLGQRIRHDFPVASLANVAAELLTTAQDHAQRSRAIRRPDWRLRALGVLLLLALLPVAGLAIAAAHPDLPAHWSLSDLVQTIEAGLSTMVFLGASSWFVLTLDSRQRRNRCLQAIHEMRAMAHVVDLHQMSKDPDALAHGEAGGGAGAPERPLAPAEMVRYLDYCSEMLGLIAKLTALYVQGFPDPVALGAVDDVQHLTTALSQKVWQKILIAELVHGTRARPAG